MTPMADAHETLTILNKLGLHARAAAMFVKTATKFESEITVEKDGQAVKGQTGDTLNLDNLTAADLMHATNSVSLQ